jgi:hypothetical protein
VTKSLESTRMGWGLSRCRRACRACAAPLPASLVFIFGRAEQRRGEESKAAADARRASRSRFAPSSSCQRIVKGCYFTGMHEAFLFLFFRRWSLSASEWIVTLLYWHEWIIPFGEGRRPRSPSTCNRRQMIRVRQA